jgi:hypothetical protein
MSKTSRDSSKLESMNTPFDARDNTTWIGEDGTNHDKIAWPPFGTLA